MDADGIEQLREAIDRLQKLEDLIRQSKTFSIERDEIARLATDVADAQSFSVLISTKERLSHGSYEME